MQEHHQHWAEREWGLWGMATWANISSNTSSLILEWTRNCSWPSCGTGLLTRSNKMALYHKNSFSMIWVALAPPPPILRYICSLLSFNAHSTTHAHTIQPLPEPTVHIKAIPCHLSAFILFSLSLSLSLSHTHTHTHTHTHFNVLIPLLSLSLSLSVCVCVCVCVERERRAHSHYAKAYG